MIKRPRLKNKQTKYQKSTSRQTRAKQNQKQDKAEWSKDTGNQSRNYKVKNSHRLEENVKT